MVISSRNTLTDTPRHHVLSSLCIPSVRSNWPIQLTMTAPQKIIKMGLLYDPAIQCWVYPPKKETMVFEELFVHMCSSQPFPQWPIGESSPDAHGWVHRKRKCGLSLQWILGNLEGYVDTLYTTLDELWKHCAGWSKTFTHTEIFYDSTDLSEAVKFIETGSRWWWWGARGRREWGVVQ